MAVLGVSVPTITYLGSVILFAIQTTVTNPLWCVFVPLASFVEDLLTIPILIGTAAGWIF